MQNHRNRRVKSLRRIAVCGLLALAGGCIADGKSRMPQERVTYVAKTEAEPAFFYRRPGVATVPAADFDALWTSIYRVTWEAGFHADLEDHRLGLLTTKPLISSQWFEPWRGDTGSLFGRLESSLATIRRTVRWEIVRNDDGTFVATPKVLVERFTLVEHRITSAAQYSQVFALTQDEQRNQRLRALDPTSFLEEPIPTAYWSSIARDEPLEKRLAEAAAGRL